MTTIPALLPTTVVGSYPQPAWLVDHEALRVSRVPRVRTPQVWRVAEPWLETAQDDATRLAIRDLEVAGIDIRGSRSGRGWRFDPPGQRCAR